MIKTTILIYSQFCVLCIVHKFILEQNATFVFFLPYAQG